MQLRLPDITYFIFPLINPNSYFVISNETNNFVNYTMDIYARKSQVETHVHEHQIALNKLILKESIYAFEWILITL